MGKYHFHGLTLKEVEISRQENGSNELEPPEVETFWEKLKENFEDPLIKILCGALVITLILSFLGYAEWIEGIGIAMAVFLATFVSTWSEWKNESSFQELQQQASLVKNNVYREGDIVSILINEIVVGDYVLLEAGDKVPADGQLVAGSVDVNQASLTGENEARRKDIPKPGYKPKDPKDFYDQYLLFRSSTIDEGEGVLLVKSVGANTNYGMFMNELNQTEERQSPLQVKLANLADGISTLGYIGATFIAVSFLFKQFYMDNGYSIANMIAYVSNWQQTAADLVTSLILGIIVIVVAVPEGLPMMIAIVLSLNMRKLLKANVLVRKLLGIETAGSINILFADKTGTLTKGQFVPQGFISGDSFLFDDFPSMKQKFSNFSTLVSFTIQESVSAILSEKGSIIGGNASDKAMLSFLDEFTLKNKEINCSIEYEYLFNSKNKFSCVQLRLDPKSVFPQNLTFQTKSSLDRKKIVSTTLVKGAPEVILSCCNHYFSPNGQIVQFNQNSRKKLDYQIEQFSNQGTRVIGLGVSLQELNQNSSSKELPQDIILVGIMAVQDEIRQESGSAVSLAQSAGIQVVMITGDKKDTATAVATQVGLIQNPEKDIILESQDLAVLSDSKLGSMIKDIRVIARALPTDKSRLVKLSQQNGYVVGMTGDGVNDSAALKASDVGFAMGSGSDVAKEASDVVILDDNFLSITKAVLYGRTIFKSIRKFIVFQSTVNFASFIPVFFGPFLGFDFPLTLIQLLWVNLVMDTLAALAFGGEVALKSYMYESPIKRQNPIVDKIMYSSIIFNGLFIGMLSIFFLTNDMVLPYFVRNGKHDPAVFLTAFFAFFIFSTNFNAFNVRTNKLNLFDHLSQNLGFLFVVFLIFAVQVTFTYLGGDILRTVALTQTEWINITAFSALIIPADLIRKLILAIFGVKTSQGKTKTD